MSSRELGPEWVLSRFISPTAGPKDEISELVVVARHLWPRIQAHARREQPEKNSDEALALATEVWESVLQSVAKTIQRSNRTNWRIKNTETSLRVSRDGEAGSRMSDERNPQAWDCQRNIPCRWNRSTSPAGSNAMLQQIIRCSADT